MDLDSTAAASLANEVQRPAFVVFIDILGDPIRVTSAGYAITFSGTGDSDLDGFTFGATDPTLLDLGEATEKEGGSETMTLTLSGILEFEGTELNLLANRANWQGRLFRAWVLLRDANGNAIGAVAHYKTGYMSAVEIVPSPTEQVIRITVENYLAALTAQPSNRTYLSQKEYDPADTSAAATIGAALGAKAGPGKGVGGGGAGGGNRTEIFWNNPTILNQV